MSHTCEDCGQMCYCDIDDMEFDEAPIDCSHNCPPGLFLEDEYEPAPPVSEPESGEQSK
jgi:hypothetical protein